MNHASISCFPRTQTTWLIWLLWCFWSRKTTKWKDTKEMNYASLWVHWYCECHVKRIFSRNDFRSAEEMWSIYILWMAMTYLTDFCSTNSDFNCTLGQPLWGQRTCKDLHGKWQKMWLVKDVQTVAGTSVSSTVWRLYDGSACMLWLYFIEHFKMILQKKPIQQSWQVYWVF